MRKLFSFFLICAAFCACSKNSAPGVATYELQSVTSTTANTYMTYTVTDITGCQYGYTIDTNQEKAQNPNNMVDKYDLYNSSSALITMKNLTPGTDYYSTAFLLTGSKVYSSKTIHFKTPAQ